MLALFLPLLNPVHAFDLDDAIEESRRLHLAEDEKWLSLLHFKNGKPQINDSRFILSANRFSPQNELIETLTLILDDNKSAKCRFPARYFYLSHFIDFGELSFEKIAECDALKQYSELVPFDKINLIYASEVLASASSMMGHSFLNASGQNINQNNVSHSISFFTELSSFNPITLIYDGLISGMDGLLLVRPYQKDLTRYREVEGRNVWSLELDVSEFDSQLIKLHIWELKVPKIDYLFQSYNCATLTLYILSIANSELKDEDVLYVSPLDLVKAVEKHNMVKSIEVNLADDWALKMLEEELDPETRDRIESLVLSQTDLELNEFTTNVDLLAIEYLERLTQRAAIKSQLSQTRLEQISEFINLHQDETNTIDLTKFKSPLETPQDSVFSTQAVWKSQQLQFDFTFLPAAHYLYGDNRQYFSESELKIGELTLRASADTGNLKVQGLTLYSFKSLAPSSAIVPKNSASFHMGYRQFKNENLVDSGFFDVSGGIGRSVKPHKDLLLYSLIEVGLASNLSDHFAYIEPSIGAIVNTVSNGKLLFEYRLSSGHFQMSNVKHKVSTAFAWHGLKNWTLRLAHQFNKTRSTSESQFQLSAGYHF